MKTVLCHFWNEEFLLPWWLKHHRRVFDHGIMIDYQSTDRSIEIIKHLCPTWDIVPSRNFDFGAHNVDTEVQEIEATLTSWRMCLNVTEFLYGDFTKLPEENTQLIVPSLMMVDTMYRMNFLYNPPLTQMIETGIPWSVHDERAGRSFHNFAVDYPKPGRHYFVPNRTNDFMIFHYGWAPMSDELLKRKLQIQDRIPEYDRTNRLGWHHITTKEDLISKWQTEYVPKIVDVSSFIGYWEHLTKSNTCVNMGNREVDGNWNTSDT
jgi:hypothetical protein